MRQWTKLAIERSSINSWRSELRIYRLYGQGLQRLPIFKELTDRQLTFVIRLKDNAKQTLLKDTPISEALSGKWRSLRDDFYWSSSRNALRTN